LLAVSPSLPTLLPDPTLLHLRELIQDSRAIRAVVTTFRLEATCPQCGQRSTRVHSWYVRKIADLPWHGVPLRLDLHLRRFFCDQPTCARRIFAERLPGVVEPYARRTVHLADALTLLGFALGGEAGARMARRLAKTVSPATVLRLVRCAASAPLPPPRVLSVDDFAFRRGQHYGSILVDLERRQVVDLLPDREAATLAAWLQAHPGAQIISRDRGGAYAEGARQGAPEAVQVADRFHLLQNLGMALDRLLTREHVAVARAVETLRARQTGVEPRQGQPAPTTATSTRVERAQVASRSRRVARYERVVRLQQEGHAIHEIARATGLSRNTVRRYLRAGTFPEAASRRRRPHRCDPFAAYLRERWNGGEHNSGTLLAEIRARGYLGSASTLRLYLAAWRTGPPQLGRRRLGEDPGPAPAPRRAWTSRQTRWVLLRPLEELDAEERAYREEVCQQSASLARAQGLATDFGRLVRERAAMALDAWLDAAEQSGIPELGSFVFGIRRDYAAVAAALTLPWSQGQTEGQVNRLKLLKRQMDGRANFDLLRQRVLRRPA
jgi:transposase